METQEYMAAQKSVKVPNGEVSYADFGDGPVALFVHGTLMSGLLWRNAIEELQSARRCIAVDLPAHGQTLTGPDQDLSITGHAEWLASFCDAVGIDRVDLVGNDTGGAICQVFAVRYPERVRTLTLTNCDVYDNLPPGEFQTGVDLARNGELAPLLAKMAEDLDLARSDAGLGQGYERPQDLDEDMVRALFAPYASDDVGRAAERRIVAIAVPHDLVTIRAQLEKLRAPTLIVWGTADHFFDIKWAYWLRDTIPGATEVVEIGGGKLFFVDERAKEFVPHVRHHWDEHADLLVEGTTP